MIPTMLIWSAKNIAPEKHQLMTDPYSDHPTEETLQRFLHDRLSEAELEKVETHILACELCVEQLEILEMLIAATKTATQLEAKPTHPQLASASASWKEQFSFPRLSLAAGIICVVTAGSILLSVPRDVTLETYRGRETPIVAAWRPMHLTLNATDLSESPVTVELVDDRGASVWSGSSAIRNDEVKVNLPRITKSGAYFVRLYHATPSDTRSELLREFTFEVKTTFR